MTTFHTFSPIQNISVFLLRPARLSYFRSPYSSYRGRYASRVGGSRGYRTRSYRSQGNFNWSWRNRLLSRLEVERTRHSVLVASTFDYFLQSSKKNIFSTICLACDYLLLTCLAIYCHLMIWNDGNDFMTV